MTSLVPNRLTIGTSCGVLNKKITVSPFYKKCGIPNNFCLLLYTVPVNGCFEFYNFTGKSLFF